jgi:hypothetical protein
MNGLAIEQTLEACGLQSTTSFVYYDDITLSFHKNTVSTIMMRDNGKDVAGFRIYSSYGKPVCAIVYGLPVKTIVWWKFRESSTTYRGLYEFLNFTGTAEGKLNRHTIEQIKQLINSVFVKEKTND